MNNSSNYDIDNEELTKGVRFNFNTFPVVREEEIKMTVPIGAIFNPLITKPSQILPGQSIRKCLKCDGVMNKYCKVDKIASVWECCFCGVRNAIGGVPKDESILEDNVEYVIDTNKRSGLVFLYLIDLQTEPQELESLKKTIIENIDKLPMNGFVGLITYDSNIFIYESSTIISKKIAFKGYKLNSNLEKLLDLNSYQPNTTLNRFFHSLNDSSSKNQLIKTLTSLKSSYESIQGKRPERCTGSSLDVSIQLLKTLKGYNCHILNFTSGPCSIGPGKITSIDKSEKIRGFNDIEKNTTKYLGDSIKFYHGLSKNCYDDFTSISCHFFVSSYDQVGIYEMKELSIKTGGVLILNDSFNMNLFKLNYSRIFEDINEDDGSIDFNSNSLLKIITSKSLKIAGFIGHGFVKKTTNLKEDGTFDMINDVEIGDGFSNEIRLNYLNKRHHFNVFFQMDCVGYSNERSSIPKQVYVQFQTRYHDVYGIEKLKIITVQRTTTNQFKIEDDFDEEATIVLITKQFIHQLIKSKLQFNEVSKKLNEILMKFLKNYGIYMKDEFQSYRIFKTYQNLPSFFYNLIHKSPILSNFNNTPDEFTYLIDKFLRISTNDSLLMIQPILLSYSLENTEGMVIPLDSNYLKHDEICLMDSFSHVLIHYGETIANWRDSELDPVDYSHIYDLIEAPQKEAMEIFQGRFPLSRYIITDDGQSQDRFLKSKLNSGIGIFSDDITLEQFYNNIIKIIIKESN